MNPPLKVESVSLADLAKAMPSGLAVYDTRHSAASWVPAPHHELLNKRLLDVAAGRTRRLIVTMPPRHGKSTLTSHYFPAWYLGRWPDRNVILASYEAGLAKLWGRRARDTLLRHGKRLFGIEVKDEVSGAKEWETVRGGGMFATGIGGPVTGRGANMLIIDDPVKNQEEARSKTIQERNIDWFKTTGLTRVQDKGGIVIVLTRWSKADLVGKILEEEGDQWEVLNLPALAEPDDVLGRSVGDALWPERFSIQELHRIRATQGPTWFSAMYQGRPSPDDGAVFKRQWFRYWEQTDDVYVLHEGMKDRSFHKSDLEVFHTMDTAATESEIADYTVISTWGITPQADLLWLDMVRVKVETTQHETMVRGAVDRWGGWVGVENATYGLRLIQAMRAQRFPIKALPADRNKVSRARVAEAAYSVGKIFHPKGAKWVGVAEEELLDFPNGAHDDIVDTVAYAGIVRAARPQGRGEVLDLAKYY